MTSPAFSRRTMVKKGAALAGLSVMQVSGPARAFQGDSGGEVIPWLDKLEPNPVPDIVPVQLDWAKLDSWITPMDQFFVVKHFNLPELNENDWSLAISGQVAKPLTFSLDDIKARARREVEFTIECSGNTGLPFFNGGVGNAKWAGTPLAPLLREAGVLEPGIEVVFWGADSGEHKYGEMTVTEHMARSMSLEDALEGDNILAYEMNGEPLPPLHGYPLRLIAPNWYGIANTKWLTHIEVLDHRFQGFFMAQEYVSIRQEERDGESVWTFTSVGRKRLKSAPAKVTKSGEKYSIMGAAWGAQIASVDVRIDDEDWQPATLTEGEGSEFAWAFWNLDWKSPSAGEHTITSRATSISGEVQPAPDDPFQKGKTTYYETNGQITRRVKIV